MPSKNTATCVDCSDPKAKNILVVWTGFNNQVICMCEQCACKYASREEAFGRLRKLAMSNTKPLISSKSLNFSGQPGPLSRAAGRY